MHGLVVSMSCTRSLAITNFFVFERSEVEALYLEWLLQIMTVNAWLGSFCQTIVFEITVSF